MYQLIFIKINGIKYPYMFYIETSVTIQALTNATNYSLPNNILN